MDKTNTFGSGETNKPDNYDFQIKDVDLEEGYKNFSTIVFTFGYDPEKKTLEF